MCAFWLKRLLALLIGIACLVAIGAAERFMYGEIMDRLTVWQWDVVNLLRIGCSTILVVGAACAIGICIFMPRPKRQEECEHLKTVEKTSRLSAEEKPQTFEQNRPPADHTNPGAVWLSRAKRAALFLTGTLFFAIFICVPWESFKYSRMVVRYGRAKAVLVEALGIVLLLCLAGATLHFIFAVLDFKRRRRSSE